MFALSNFKTLKSPRRKFDKKKNDFHRYTIDIRTYRMKRVFHFLGLVLDKNIITYTLLIYLFIIISFKFVRRS